MAINYYEIRNKIIECALNKLDKKYSCIKYDEIKNFLENKEVTPETTKKDKEVIKETTKKESKKSMKETTMKETTKKESKKSMKETTMKETTKKDKEVIKEMTRKDSTYNKKYNEEQIKLIKECKCPAWIERKNEYCGKPNKAGHYCGLHRSLNK
jgi:6-pyruvoyl-tetrahydropterin synthase